MGIQSSANSVESSCRSERFGTCCQCFLFLKPAARLQCVRNSGKQTVDPDAGQDLKAENTRGPKIVEAVRTATQSFQSKISQIPHQRIDQRQADVKEIKLQRQTKGPWPALANVP